MVIAAPFFIFFGVSAVVGLLFYSFYERMTSRLSRVTSIQVKMPKEIFKIKPEELALIVLGETIVVWFGIVMLTHPGFMWGIVLLPIVLGVSILGTLAYVKMKIGRRQNAFMPQLELSLRMMSSALRVGLGLRQAMILVTEELADPAREEFTRVVGRTTLGVGIVEALEELGERMPSNEMMMAIRSMRIQTQTGGDLAKVLENVANTIKARRTVYRKMRALTAEGRMSGYIIVALPLVVGGFICVSQPAMGHALLFTGVGHISLALVAALEAAAGLMLASIMKFDV